jgi:uncharacterized protein YggE
MSMNPSLSSLAAVGLLLASPLLALAQAGSAADDSAHHRRMERTISVTGNGKVSAAPDIAEISIAVVSQADTARAALAANTEAMTAVQKLLKERGVAEKDIQTTQISVTPRYTQPAPPRPGQAQATEFVPRIAGYDVTNAVQITARDIGKLGTILDAVVQSGANRIDNIAFRIDEPEKLLDQARKRAMADAKRKAEQLAGDSGVVVGPPITISESGGMPPVPMYGGVRGRMMEMAAAAPVPVAAGEQELSVNVSVIYELRLPE